MAICGAAARRGLKYKHYAPTKALARRFTSLAKFLGAKDIAERLSRGSFPDERRIEIDKFGEALRTLAVLLPWHRLQKSWMYESKRRFDAAVAKDVSGYVGMHVGMPGSCLKAFKSLNNAYKVLHQVDAHPSYHNSILLSHHTKEECWGELVPRTVTEQVCQEAELADTILVPSNIVAKQFIATGVKPDKLLVIPYGVNLGVFKPDFRPAPQKDKPTILFVGQISFRKGIPTLLSAVRGLNLRLNLVGPMVSKKSLSRISDNVSYLGPMGRHRVVEAMLHADCFVLPSLEDACALVVAEAIACGLPVITTSANGASEVLLPASAAIVEAGNVSQLRAALARVKVLGQEERRFRAKSLFEGANPNIRDWSMYGADVLDKLYERSDLIRRSIVEKPASGY